MNREGTMEPKWVKEISYMVYYTELYSLITWHAHVNDFDKTSSSYSRYYSNRYPI